MLQVYKPESSGHHKESDQKKGETKAIVTVDLTERGYAIAFIKIFVGLVFYCSDTKAFLTWNGHFFQAGKEALEGFVWEFIKTFKQWVMSLDDFAPIYDVYGEPVSKMDLIKECKRIAQLRFVKTIIEILKSMPEVLTTSSTFDIHKHLLNCLNGVVDLTNGLLMPPSQEYRFTKMTNIDYVLGANSRRLNKFFRQITCRSSTLLRYLILLFGYALFGHLTEQIIPIFYGRGGNGKSTLMEIINAALGDYTISMPMQSLMRSSTNPLNNGLALMEKTRISSYVEMEKNATYNMAKLKSYSGGDTIADRLPYKGYQQLDLQSQIFLLINDLPNLEPDDAMKRRVRVIPFNAKFEGKNRDDQIKESLMQKEVLEALLAKLVQGAVDWHNSRLPDCPEVEQATTAFWDDSDSVKHFLKDCFTIKPKAWTSLKEVREIYADWVENSGYRRISDDELSRQLKAKGFKQGHSGSVRKWKRLSAKMSVK